MDTNTLSPSAHPAVLAALLILSPAGGARAAEIAGEPVETREADAVLGAFEGADDTLFWFQRDARAGLTSETVRSHLAQHPKIGTRDVGGMLRDLREGFSYVRAHPPVMLALIATSMSIFNGAVSAMRPVFARHVLQVDSTGYGVMAAAAGLGGLLAAAVMAGLRSAPRPGLMMGWSMLGFSTGIFLYAFAFSYSYVLAVEFAMGVCGQIWYVYTFSGLQLAVPQQMRGRVVSLVFMLVMLAPVGALFVGMLADAVGDKVALRIFGLVPMIVLGGILLFGSCQLRAL